MEHFVTEGERTEEEKEKSGRNNKRRERRGGDARYLAECLCRSRADFSDNTAGGGEKKEKRRGGREGLFFCLFWPPV